MSDASITATLLDELRKFDTPTICNALEIVAPERRDIGFTTGAMAMRSGGNEAGRTSEQKANRHAFLFHTDAALGTGIPGERRNLILAKTDEDGQEETLNPVRRLR